MNLTREQLDTVDRFQANVERGLTTDEATQRREENGTFNVVKPPVDCPAWICCLLPCIKSIPSMKAFQAIKPDDAEVLRNGKWVRYDATSLVQGDVIRLEEGDVVPADCIVLENSSTSEELLVDVRAVVGDEKLLSYPASSSSSAALPLLQLYMGNHVVQGGATAVITAIGPDTLLATLIKEGNFPPKGNVLQDGEHEREDGISLISRTPQVT